MMTKLEKNSLPEESQGEGDGEEMDSSSRRCTPYKCYPSSGCKDTGETQSCSEANGDVAENNTSFLPV